jgi:membrane-bound lytic murein transglycosylase
VPLQAHKEGSQDPRPTSPSGLYQLQVSLQQKQQQKLLQKQQHVQQGKQLPPQLQQALPRSPSLPVQQQFQQQLQQQLQQQHSQQLQTQHLQLQPSLSKSQQAQVQQGSEQIPGSAPSQSKIFQDRFQHLNGLLTTSEGRLTLSNQLEALEERQVRFLYIFLQVFATRKGQQIAPQMLSYSFQARWLKWASRSVTSSRVFICTFID